MQRLLVVEDEPNLRHVLEYVLRDRYFVSVVEHRDDALLSLQQVPHLILMDMDMPGLGLEPFLVEQRRLCPATKVVLMSGHNDHDEAARHGVSLFLYKPFSFDQLFEVLRLAELG